jgi:putative flippase GtrA
MKARVAIVLKKPFVRYLLVGGGVYALELLVIITGQRAGLAAVPAVALAFWVGLLVSFVLQKFVTFGDHRTHHKIVLKQFLAVSLLVVWNFLFTIVVARLLAQHAPATVTRSIALLITTLWNFYLYKTSIFRGPENPVY